MCLSNSNVIFRFLKVDFKVKSDIFPPLYPPTKDLLLSHSNELVVAEDAKRQQVRFYRKVFSRPDTRIGSQVTALPESSRSVWTILSGTCCNSWG